MEDVKIAGFIHAEYKDGAISGGIVGAGAALEVCAAAVCLQISEETGKGKEELLNRIGEFMDSLIEEKKDGNATIMKGGNAVHG